jgi:hypothetical protein
MPEPISWGADGAVSLPQPKEHRPEDDPVEKRLGSGWVFTPMGLRHDLTEADREALYTATYSPEEHRG